MTHEDIATIRKLCRNNKVSDVLDQVCVVAREDYQMDEAQELLVRSAIDDMKENRA